ncbi:MAG: hypothetical protein ABS76_26755 [Pelagibacterium sp. SCN 64-44]|nr:MAG: hypothetical protein ABS76_26755 [Pelagibacterium sp. SCN 64-44]
MLDAEKRALIERYVRAYNDFNVDAMLATLAPDIRFENYAGEQLTVDSDGIDAFRRLAEQAAAHFRQREQRLLSVSIGPKAALTRVAYRGVLAGPSGDYRSGTVIELEGTTEFTFASGLIAKIVDCS